MRRPLLGVAILVAFAVLLPVAPAASAARPVSLIEMDSAITPVTVRLLITALDRAQGENAQALIVQLNTPGGLERSMRSMVQSILGAPIPVIVYVAPTGARAASAGVFITMAAHVAAMAPATNIGAAHPVAVGGSMDKEMSKKVENDAAAFARTIAAERGRNAEWAEQAVRSSVSATEREAVKLKVVDLIAENVPDLLAKIDGRTVKTAKGPMTFATKDAPVKVIEVSFRDRFLALISDPNIAYLLMMAGMLGIFFELSNPGSILPGVIGGICLILAFFAFQSLPVNWAGLLLLLFGVVLLIVEIKVVSHGILTVGGVIGAEPAARALVLDMHDEINQLREFSSVWPDRPRVYFEEWHDPLITGIRWVSELIELAGGRDVFSDLRDRRGARDRVVDPAEVARRDPEIILVSWCGKPADVEVIRSRPGWDRVSAVQHGRVHEIDGADVLSPGPSMLVGLRQIHELVQQALRERD